MEPNVDSCRSKQLFRNLNADDPDPETTEIESVCLSCFKDGTTRLLLTMIPFYKEVVLMSFSCDHCGARNNQLQHSSEIQEKGIRIVLKVTNVKDLNRRIVKSDHTSVRISEIDFEIPSNSQRGEITTLEGIIDRSVAGLEQDQTVRRVEHPEIAEQIETFIKSLNELKTVDSPFTVIFEDISGNCFVENPNAPHADPNSSTRLFSRTLAQDHEVGIIRPDELTNDTDDGPLLKPIAEDAWPLEELHGEVLRFDTMCPECRAPCQTNMKVTTVPHFKDVVIMATVCDVCNHRTNEVKSGSGIEPEGVKFEVTINGREDFSRDVLKSDTCSVSLAELDCEVGAAALGGRFTTIEGLITAMRDQLTDGGGLFRDSQDTEMGQKMAIFLKDLDDVITGNRKITVILDDPAGNSYVQSLRDDGTPDDNLKITRYERTFDQNEELGLNDMKTENY